MPPDDRIYSEEEIGRVLQRAAEIQGKQSRTTGSGLTISELQQLAFESGIDPRFIALATKELDADQVRPASGLWGGPFSETLIRSVEGPISDETWEEVLAVLRRDFEETGITERRGATRQWTLATKDGRKGHLIATYRNGWTDFELFWANQTMIVPYIVIPLFFGIMAFPVIFGALSITGAAGFAVWLVFMTLLLGLTRAGVSKMASGMRRRMLKAADSVASIAERGRSSLAEAAGASSLTEAAGSSSLAEPVVEAADTDPASDRVRESDDRMERPIDAREDRPDAPRIDLPDADAGFGADKDVGEGPDSTDESPTRRSTSER